MFYWKLRRRRFFLNEILQMSNLNSLFPEISFLELPKYSWNLEMLSIIEKFKNWKTILKKSWKIGIHFGRRNSKIGWPLGTLVRQFETLARLWHVGTPSLIIGAPLACWHAKLSNWYTFVTLARWYVGT